MGQPVGNIEVNSVSYPVHFNANAHDFTADVAGITLAEQKELANRLFHAQERLTELGK